MRPLPNRVDPFGALHAVSARGTLMGNRGGRFHLDGQTLGKRRWASRQWIACVCSFKGRRRTVWGTGYTEIFFLDEVTALSAGHRPCFECRRADALAFQARFEGGGLKAGEMDKVLHVQRLKPPTRQQPLDDLPDATMVALDGTAWAVAGRTLLPWAMAGYGPPQARRMEAPCRILTPPAIVAVLRLGYRPAWHETARASG